MAHFAKLNGNNVVEQVIVVSNNDCLDENGNESELKGIQFCKSLFGEDTVWKQTSYNSNFRKNYAGIGFKYDESRDAFISFSPFRSWVLNETTCQWESPIPYPDDNKKYLWDETTTSWKEILNE